MAGSPKKRARREALKNAQITPTPTIIPTDKTPQKANKSAKKLTNKQKTPQYDHGAIMETICELIAQKQTLTMICQLPGMPAYQNVYQWMHEDADLHEMYARARVRRASARGDKIDDYCRMVVNGKLDSQAAKVCIDAEKWQMAKESPREFGEKLDINHSGSITLEALVGGE